MFGNAKWLGLFGLSFALWCWESAMAAPAENDVGAPPVSYDPIRHWEIDYETGVLWRVTGSATPLSYSVLPQILTIKSPLVGTTRDLFGGDFVVRSRFSLLAEPIAAGPEHYYLGGAASGSLEWWNTQRNLSVFFASGGGLGWLDSKGHEISGGFGEDFNFNWLVYPGVRFIYRRTMSISLGIYFQHLSNSGFNKVNPGLNAVGPMLSLGWHF